MSSDTGINTGSSDTTSSNGNVSQPQENTTEHQQVFSTFYSLYPHLEDIGISNDNPSHAAIAGSGVDASDNAVVFSSAGQYPSSEYMHSSPSLLTSSSVPHVLGPSVISHQVLPTYRQVTMTAGGSHPSGNPSTGSEPIPYHMESSLPDILHSHMVPRIPPARPNQHRHHRSRNSREEGASTGHRHRHRTQSERSGRHRIPSARTQSSSSSQTQENSCKEPCVKCVVTVTSFRWVLVVLSVLGVSCVTAGIVLAALHPAVGTSLLYLSVMFIGEYLYLLSSQFLLPFLGFGVSSQCLYILCTHCVSVISTLFLLVRCPNSACAWVSFVLCRKCICKCLNCVFLDQIQSLYLLVCICLYKIYLLMSRLCICYG